MRDEVKAVVKALTDARLLVTDRDKSVETTTVEIAHEALIVGWKRLRDWLDADRAFGVWRQKLVAALRTWQELGRDKGTLFRGPLLTEAQRENSILATQAMRFATPQTVLTPSAAPTISPSLEALLAENERLEADLYAHIAALDQLSEELESIQEDDRAASEAMMSLEAEIDHKQQQVEIHPGRQRLG